MSSEQVRIALNNQAAIHQRAGFAVGQPDEDAANRLTQVFELLRTFDPRIGQLDKLIAQQRQWLEMQW